jgi:hypothetical protein
VRNGGLHKPNQPPMPQLKVAVTVMLLLKLSITQVVPDTVLQPAHPPNVDPTAAAAVNVTVVPVGKLALQPVAQPSPTGELDTVPRPFPAKSSVMIGPLKQTILAVI